MTKITKKEIEEMRSRLDPKIRIEVPEGCAKASERFSEKDWEAVVMINDEISKRTSYGTREERADEPSIVLSWSNAGKTWYIMRRKVDTGEIETLDANQLLVPISSVRYNRIKECLGVLPLYFGSTEAWSKGEMAHADAIEIWAYGQLERMQRELDV